MLKKRTEGLMALLGLGTILAREAIRDDAAYWGVSEAYVRFVWLRGISMREAIWGGKP